MLQQTHSVYVYFTEFEVTALSIPDASNFELLYSFFLGLHDQIGQEVHLEASSTITHAPMIGL